MVDLSDNLDELHHRRNSCITDNLTVDSKVLYQIHSVLNLIENAILTFSGCTENSLPRRHNKRTIDDLFDWLKCGSVTVQQAVSLLLNYYRTVMEEQMFRPPIHNSNNDTTLELQASIYGTMNRFETAVWENNWFQVKKIVSNKEDKFQAQGTCKNDNVYSAVVFNNPVNHSLPQKTDDTQCKMETDQDLMVENIDETIEQRFVEDLSKHHYDILDEDFNDGETKHALQMMLDDEVSTEVAKETKRQDASNQDLYAERKATNNNGTEVYCAKKLDF